MEKINNKNQNNNKEYDSISHDKNHLDTINHDSISHDKNHLDTINHDSKEHDIINHDKKHHNKKKLNRKKYNSKIICILFISLLLIISLSCVIGFSTKNKKVKSDKENNNNKVVELKRDIQFSLNDKIPTIDAFLVNGKKASKNDKLEIYLDDKPFEEDTFSKIGEYQIKLTIDNKEYETKINIEDKQPPVLTLKELKINENTKYTINSFITSCTDNSKKNCTLKFVDSKMASYTKPGTYNIQIKAIDIYNNETIATTKLTINSNTITKNSNKTTSNNNNNKTTSNKTTSNKTTSNKTTSNKNTTTTKKNNTVNYTTAGLKSQATTNVAKYTKEINEILKYTNQYRAAANKNDKLNRVSLTLDKDLCIAANVRVLEIAYSGKISHTRPNGNPWYTVVTELKLTNRKYLGENIAAYQINAFKAAEAWRNSKSHYENMINPEFTRIGIGAFYYNGKYYWTQLFSN